MGSVNIHSLSIVCKAYGLSVLTDEVWETSANVILPHDSPFSVQITLAFENSNAIALLALSPTIQADFYAAPLQAGNKVDLGSSTLTAESQQTTYAPQLELQSPAVLGLVPHQVYRLGVLVRIGALHQPALLCGVVEELMAQVHAALPEQSPKSPSKKRSTKAKK